MSVEELCHAAKVGDLERVLSGTVGCQLPAVIL